MAINVSAVTTHSTRGSRGVAAAVLYGNPHANEEHLETYFRAVRDLRGGKLRDRLLAGGGEAFFISYFGREVTAKGVRLDDMVKAFRPDNKGRYVMTIRDDAGHEARHDTCQGPAKVLSAYLPALIAAGIVLTRPPVESDVEPPVYVDGALLPRSRS